MSILIKGIEMPKNCLNCPMCNGNDECVLQSEEDNALFETWEEQKDGCPLVEVSVPHGDLIDRNALIEFCAERWIPLNIDAVNMQPTIQTEEAIPVSWIEARIKRFMTMDNAFGGLTANIMLVMLNEWKREQEGETE